MILKKSTDTNTESFLNDKSISVSGNTVYNSGTVKLLFDKNTVSEVHFY